MLATLVALPLALQSPSLAIEGRVIAPDGAPCANIDVVVGCQAEVPFEPFPILTRTRSDGAGRFVLELPGEWIDRTGSYKNLDVFAHGSGFGFAMQSWELNQLPVGFEAVLRLPARVESRVRFLNPQGEPVVGARVYPQGIRRREGGEFRIPVAYWQDGAALTDEQGWATLPLEREQLERIGLQHPRYGQQHFGKDWSSKGPLPEELIVVDVVQRPVEWEGVAPAGAALEVTSYRVNELDGGAKYVAMFDSRAALDPTAEVLWLPPGALKASIVTYDASALAYGFELGTRSEENDLLRFLLPEPVRVTGRILSAEDGKPVAGVRLFVRGQHKGWVTSDEQGVFSFDCGSPRINLTSLVAPPGFAHVQFLEHSAGERPVQGPWDVGVVEVQQTWSANGIVRGPEGAPRSGVWLVGSQQIASERFRRTVNVTALSDTDGRFVLHGAEGRSVMTVQARSGDSQAEVQARPGEELELVLVPTLPARGVLTDAAGAPAAGVTVEIWRASPPRMIGGEERVALGGSESVRTAADGAFQTGGGLEAEEQYCLVWSGAGVLDGRSDWYSGAQLAAGVEASVERFGSLRGVLRAEDGQPLADTEVRLRRSGSATRTDSNGEFEIGGLAGAGDVLITEDPAGVTHVRWATPDDSGLDWRLLPHNSERLLEGAPPHDRSRELEIAFELLEKGYQSALAAGDETALLRAVQCLAWADPALVLQRVEEGLFETPWRQEFSLAYVADALLHDSPEESLAVSMRLTRGMSQALSMLDAAELLEPAAEREQLALVRAQARAVDPPEHRVVVLGRLADRLLDLGEREAALSVLAEGRALAHALPAEEWAGFARSRFGETLSRVDPVAGRELIDQLASAVDRPRHLGNTAHKLAASDPAAAEALLEELSRESSFWRADRYVSRIVYSMAAVDPERAESLAERYDPTGFSHGMLALALLDKDPKQASAQLARAFERAESTSEAHLSWDDRPVAHIAALLPVAERIDPGGLAAWVARAVALRRPPERGPFGGDDVVWREDATLAYYLARWDRALARALLEPAVEVAGKLKGYELGQEYDPVWAAAAVIDPEWAAELAREFGGRAAQKVGLVLGIPPDQRTRYVQGNLIGLWVVGKEDL